MRICIFMGSPKPNGNTAELCKHFINELKLHQIETEYIELHGKNIAPCIGCYHCQNTAGEYGCIQQDDMQSIVESILRADVLVYATPIYSWQATPPMKTVMDRMFGLNKFYRSAPRKVLNAGQAIALIATCGYEIDYGAGLLDETLRRGCEHSGLQYLGMFAVRDVDGLPDFQTADAITGAQEFARDIMKFERRNYL
ncbi:MAG: flavodoxin family protein [Oscillospiraceae bacterium]|nr:flavodoxin family protein [Oscillospiraceae bacterium]